MKERKQGLGSAGRHAGDQIHTMTRTKHRAAQGKTQDIVISSRMYIIILARSEKLHLKILRYRRILNLRSL